MAQKLIADYGGEYKVVEIKDTIFFGKKKPLGAWQLDKVEDITLKDLFDCGKENLLVVVMRFYQDLFLGSINNVGVDSGYMCPKTKEMSLEPKNDSFMEVLFFDEGKYYNKKGEVINLKQYL